MTMIGVEEPVREEGQIDVRWGFGPPDYLVGSSHWFIGLLVFCPTNWHMIAIHGQLCWKDKMLTAVIV